MPTTITKEYTAYTYDELTDDAKQQVYDDRYRDAHFEDIESTWRFWLEDIGLSCLKIHYDIGFCQGDGVGFSGRFDMSDVTDANFDRIVRKLWTRTDGTGRLTWPAPALDGQVEVEAAPHDSAPSCIGVEVILELPADADEGVDVYDEELSEAVKEYLRSVGTFFYRYATDQILDCVKWLDEYIADSDDDYRYDKHGRMLSFSNTLRWARQQRRNRRP